MNTKEKIIRALEEAKGEYVSGEGLAEEFGLSRNAIWKGINELKKDGYQIESVRNKGYMLPEDTDMISKAGIALCLEKEHRSSSLSGMLDNLHVYDELDSTNIQARRELLLEDFDIVHKTVIIAKTQSSGRGHRGTLFDSPDGGIYLSMILDPAKLHSPQTVTGDMADIVTAVLEEQYGIKAVRKKDNSIYMGKEKICGILTEAVSDLETGIYSSFIVGIGIRADMLRKTSRSGPSRNRVIASLMAGFAKI
ncbi:MAG: HTH domain-containing protein [Lachnospiraceae bacterium]|nr:HTH domain-containing protein [Lachnospiraceae bacterium]